MRQGRYGCIFVEISVLGPHEAEIEQDVTIRRAPADLHSATCTAGFAPLSALFVWVHTVLDAPRVSLQCGRRCCGVGTATDRRSIDCCQSLQLGVVACIRTFCDRWRPKSTGPPFQHFGRVSRLGVIRTLCGTRRQEGFETSTHRRGNPSISGVNESIEGRDLESYTHV